MIDLSNCLLGLIHAGQTANAALVIEIEIRAIAVLLRVAPAYDKRGALTVRRIADIRKKFVFQKLIQLQRLHIYSPFYENSPCRIHGKGKWI